MSSSTSSSLWNDGLKLISYCPLCDTRYNPMQARVLGEDGETHLLHVTCRKCENSILAVVLTNESGVSSVGLVTDLTYDDVLRFQSGANISIDDVIDVHSFVEGDSWKKLYRPGVVQTKRRAVAKIASASAKASASTKATSDKSVNKKTKTKSEKSE